MATPITGNALRPRDERKWLTAGPQTLVIVMSALGQKRTYAVQKSMTALPPIATAKAKFRKMSALPPKADMCGANRHVCFGPIADMCSASL
jgi:N12 class adenine-specific DNA methylase